MLLFLMVTSGSRSFISSSCAEEWTLIGRAQGVVTLF
jgi:hypothetical protein